MAVKVSNSCLALLTLVLVLSLYPKLSFCEESNDTIEITKLYVRPDNTTHCPDWIKNRYKCETLSYYIQKVDTYFVSNTCMEFLEGDHVMEINRAIRMEDITNFSLMGNISRVLTRDPSDGSPLPSSRIVCSGSRRSGFYFINSSDIWIENIAISHCGLRLSGSVKVLAALAFDTVINVQIANVRIQKCTGFGIHADRLLGNSTISDSAFVQNVGTKDFYGGNVRFWYQKCPPNVSTSLLIKKSWFKYGYDITKTGAFYPYASGLTLLVDCPYVHAVIDNITSVYNVADNGGNLAIRLNFAIHRHGIGSVLLKNSLIMKGKGHRGGGLRVWSRIYVPKGVACSKPFQNYTTLLVKDTTFVGNHGYSAGGALYISHYEQEHTDCFVRTLKFVNCTFQNNSVPPFGNGAVAEIIKHKIFTISQHFSPQFQVVFNNSRFVNNWILQDERKLIHGGILDIFSVDKIIFESCQFIHNNSTALSTVDSNVVLSGQLVFRNNSAVNGGAIKVCDSSYIYIMNNTAVLFERNNASNAGGAIFAQQRCLESAPSCFFQPLVNDFTKLSDFGTSIHMSLKFVNNTAKNAGFALYGGSVDYCYTFNRFVNGTDESFYLSYEVFNRIFDISSNNHPHNDISSAPYGVCLCDPKTNTPLCDKKHKTKLLPAKYPGEPFSISAVTVGQRSGLSPAVISGVVIDNNRNVLYQKSQEPLRNCSMLKFIIHTYSEKPVKFNLTVEQANLDSSSFYYRYHYPQITVPLKPCPWGFTLQNDSNGWTSCKGHPAFLRDHIQYNLTTGYVTRRGSKWVGFDWSKFKSVEEYNKACSQENASHNCRSVMVSKYCPYDYCNHSKISINAKSIDQQCNFDHTGILCGACAKGKSLSLGSSHCRGCNNDTILPVILVVLIAGVVMVFLLIILNLTVTEGTINGLIFYMNFIEVNKSLYFPDGGQWYGSKVLVSIVATFNLNLGFPVCFFAGMDAYLKTWFQFMFPIYIWLIVVVIIVLSRKFIIVQRLIGKNAVKILATLFLLSVAKLNLTIIAVFSYVNIKIPYGSGNVVSVWIPDGNVRFLQGKHIFLFIGGLVFLILILIYTVLVMFNMCLQRLPNKSPFSFICRLKPFFDAYTGPYKSRCRFWTGLLLLTRSLLFTLFSVTVLKNPGLKLMITSLMCLLFLAMMSSFYGVYKRLYLNILETIALLNLGIVSSISSYMYLVYYGNTKGDIKTVIVSSISVFLACLTYVVIIFFHGYRQIRSSKILRNFLSSISRSPSTEELLSNMGDVEQPTGLLSQTEVTFSPPAEAEAREFLQNMNGGQKVPEVERFSQCREPLIESQSDS